MSDDPRQEAYAVELQQQEQYWDDVDLAAKIYTAIRYDGLDGEMKQLCGLAKIDFDDVVAMVAREAA